MEKTFLLTDILPLPALLAKVGVGPKEIEPYNGYCVFICEEVTGTEEPGQQYISIPISIQLLAICMLFKAMYGLDFMQIDNPIQTILHTFDPQDFGRPMSIPEGEQPSEAPESDSADEQEDAAEDLVAVNWDAVLRRAFLHMEVGQEMSLGDFDLTAEDALFSAGPMI